MATGPGKLGNSSIGQGEVWGAPQGVVIGQDGQVIKEMVATVAVNIGDTVILDPATSPYNVTKSAVGDSVLRYGTVVAAAGVGAKCWVAIEGVVQMIAGAAIAQSALLGTSANAAGQVKTAVAAVHSVLGVALTAAAGAASVFLGLVDKS